MENILHLYEQPHDPKRPLVCIDERPCQLIGDVLVPLPMVPGKPQREGYQYKRNGVCTVFIAVEPLTGWRFIYVSRQRRKIDYAAFMAMVAQHYAQAETIVIVQDNLNTHTPGSFYAAWVPTEAFALAQRFEICITHPTKPVGSIWLKLNSPFCLSNV